MQTFPVYGDRCVLCHFPSNLISHQTSCFKPRSGHLVLEFLDFFELLYNFFDASNVLAKGRLFRLVLEFFLNSKFVTKFGPHKLRKKTVYTDCLELIL